MTHIQRLRSTNLLSKIFRKTNLVILEEANTTYALILILITQNYTDTEVCKFLIQPFFVRHTHSLPLLFSFFRTHQSNFFFLGALTNK